MLRRRGQRERQKSNWFRLEKQQLHVHHAFLHISLPSLHDYDVELPSFTFCEGRGEKTTIFSFLFLNLDTVL